MRLLPCLLIFISTIPLYGQYRTQLIPRSSPDKLVFQKVGYTEIEITYGSPKVNGRKIWGSLVPENEVWRCGANEATTIYLSRDVEINNKPISSGRYAIFMIPSLSSSWTIIFNKIYDQWGSYSYEEEFDVLRLEVNPNYADKFNEELEYRIEQRDFQNARITFDWEKLNFNLDIKTNFQTNLTSTLEQELEASSKETHWVIYLQAAEFLVKNNLGIDQALSWLESSNNLSQNIDPSNWSNQFYPIEFIRGHLLWTYAKAYASKKDYSSALQYAEKMKAISGEETFYIWENEAEDIDATIAKWSKLN